MTSFIGILALGIAEHDVLVIFFKFFFVIFLLAMFHGLTVVPVVLHYVQLWKWKKKKVTKVDNSGTVSLLKGQQEDGDGKDVQAETEVEE